MEISDYLTNVLSINDLSSIQYYYLEPSTGSESGQNSISDIEATWRQSGALVAHYKFGIWIFGKGGEPESILPLTTTIRSDSLIEFEGNTFVAKQHGTLDPSTIWKAPKSVTTSSGVHNGVNSPPLSADNSVRTAQAANAKAVLSNTPVDTNKENGADSSPLNCDFAVMEPIFTARDIQEHFISAVLATLSYHLCHDSGFVALNARTLVLPASEYFRASEDYSKTVGGEPLRERIWLVTLDVHLTSLGTLIVKAWPYAPFDLPWSLSARQDLCMPRSLIDGATLFLAPIGKVARYCGSTILGVSETTVDTITLPVEQYFSGSPLEAQSTTRWKQRCLNWLANKGMRIDSLDNSGWLTVQIRSQTNLLGPIESGGDGLWSPEEKLVTILWPTVLCFRRITSDMAQNPESKLPRGHNPLSFAEGWFTSRAIREATMAKRRKERESASAAVLAQAEADARNMALNNFSPAGLRRASIAGAVYPTPPDGIQPVIGATPSFDGNGSTPGHPTAQAMVIESDNIAVPKSEVEYADTNLWDPNETKRDPISSALDFNDNDNDNIFGDMGGDSFDENGVTDADFNYFDEPETVENAEDCTAGDETAVEGSRVGGIEQHAVVNDLIDPVGFTSGPDAVMTGAHFEENHEINVTELSPYQTSLMKLDANAENDLSKSQTHTVVKGPPSPPLSPDLIFKRLSTVEFASSSMGEVNPSDRTISSFGGVAFGPSLFSFNEKYGARGRFNYPSMPKSFDRRVSKDLPKTGYLNKTRKQRSPAANLSNQALISPEMLVPELDNHDSSSNLESTKRSRNASPISDQDDTSDSSGDGPLTLSQSLKRKRGADDTDDDDEITSSFQDLKVDRAQFLQTLGPPDLIDQNLIDADPADWSLASFLSSPEPRNVTCSLSDAECVASAQVLADQAISRTLHIPLVTDNVDNAERGIHGHSVKNLVQKKLSQAVKSCFNWAIECTMATFTDVQDLQPMGLVNRLPPRPTLRGPLSSEAMKLNAIFNLPAPHLEVQRSESKLTVLPPAVPFWESLGLAPCKGSKDISAICIYPDGGGVADGVDAFLDQIRSAYESSRLGSHERFSNADLVEGRVPIDFGDNAMLSVADHQALLMRIKETSTRVGAILAAGPINESNIVIYYVYDSTIPELLVPICSAFHDLFEVYKETLVDEKLPASNELVFQLVPLNFIASKASLVVPTPLDYTRLAMEVYDRCVDLNTGTSVPSIILEQPLPRAIDFKLTPNPSASPLQENSCLHVAYAQSQDDRWITAAWTDNTGSRQMTASYCLGRRNVPLSTPFSDVAREIWETTLGIIAVQKVNWRIMIAKSGIMDTSEIEIWKALALAATESNAQVALTLITVDTNPSLQLLPSSILAAPNVLVSQSSVLTTPVSTPQASIFSPEPGNASTPAKDTVPPNAPTPNDTNAELKIDADATLTDVTDQTWGAILSHRLNNSRSLLEFYPTLISGYLIKRSGASPSDVPIVVEVNIIHSEVHPIKHNPLLREILALYRCFATLARVRGCVDPMKDGRPWHIAAAENSVQALYMLM